MPKKTKSNNEEQNKDNQQNKRFIVGLFLVFFGIIILVSLVSFLFTGGRDRSIFDIPFTDLISDTNISVCNIMGKSGAWISDMLITDGIGLMSLVVPFLLIAAGFMFMGIKLYSFRKLLWHSFLLAVWGSVTLGFVFYRFSDQIYLLIGGSHGYYTAKWLMSAFGAIGTFLILLLMLLSYLSIYLPPFQAKLLKFIQFISKGRIRIPQLNTHEIENPIVDGLDTPIVSQVDNEDINSIANSVDNPILPQEEEKLPQINEINTSSCIGQDADNDAGVGVNNKEGQEQEKEQFSVTVAEGDKDDDVNHKKLDEPYDPTLDLEYYKYPTIDLLTEYQNENTNIDEDELLENKNKITKTLNDFSIKIDSIKATVGPTVTLYEIVPAPGVKISRIQSLENDIALSLAALGIRIIAPIPGQGTIGIEVPNSKPQIVSMYSVIKTPKFQNSTYELPVVLGKTISNETFVFDLAKTPHLLVAGATGQGKSVGLNAIITSLLYKKHPSQVKFVLVDPKMVEFSVYNDLMNHFLAKIPSEDKAIITDVEKVKATLNSLTVEMDSRYELLMEAGERNIKDYNKKFIARHLNPEKGHRFMPYIVVIIDEFADLLMTAGKEIEMPIARIAQKARAVGIHMILATQRPSANVITGIIKANFPSRIAFKVSSMVDSRTILDASGAQHLIGRGDMLFSMDSKTTRIQCAFIDTPEVVRINKYVKEQQGYACPFELPEAVVAGLDSDGPSAIADAGKLDPLFREVAQMVVSSQAGSTSNIQRRFSLGYNRAGKLMDQLERFGIVGPAEGSKPRAVLVQTESDLERILQGAGV